MALDRRFLESTRGQIVGLLRRAGRTVNELAAVLGLTDNAVRAHLTTLERDGLVRAAGQQKGTRKPNVLYGLTDEAEQLFPKRSGVVLGLLLDVLGGRMPKEQVEQVLRDVGHRVAAEHLPELEGLGPRERAERAAELLKQLGGLAEVEEREGRLVIQGYSCPLGELVPGHPEVCLMAETLVSDLVGEPVRECCQKGGRPRCCFDVRPAE